MKKFKLFSLILMFSSILFGKLGMKDHTNTMKEYIPKLSYIKKEDDTVTYFNNIGESLWLKLHMHMG